MVDFNETILCSPQTGCQCGHDCAWEYCNICRRYVTTDDLECVPRHNEIFHHDPTKGTHSIYR